MNLLQRKKWEEFAYWEKLRNAAENTRILTPWTAHPERFDECSTGHKKHTYREDNTMIVLTITPRKKRIRDFFIKREPQRQFFNYEFPKEAKATNEPTNRDA